MAFVSKNYFLNKTIHKLFEEQVLKTPDSIAVQYNEQSLTYTELNYKANQLAHYLRKQGCGPEKLVAICLERSFEMIIGILGILKAGGAYVPIDPNYSEIRIQHILEDSQTEIILIKNAKKSLKHCFNNTFQKQLIDLDSYQTKPSSKNIQNPLQKIKPDNLAYVIYTSGSTGKPKGVMVDHINVNNYINWFITNFHCSEQSIFDFSSPLTFDFSVTCALLPLLCGASIVICDQEVKLSPDAYLTHLKTQNISHIKITPGYLNLLLRKPKLIEQLKELKWIILGGEALYKKDTQKWLSINPHHQLVNEYGPTETTVATIAHIVSKDNIADYENIPIGKPASNTNIYIANEQSKLVAKGEKGELYIGGKSVSRGYLNQPKLTQEKFIKNPFSNDPNDRLYKTGDLVRELPDGNLEYIGRIDNQVKIRGFRVELGEIENTLLNHPFVRQCAVISAQTQPTDIQLIAYLVLDLKTSTKQTKNHQQIKEWQTIFDNFYEDSLNVTEANFNITGWLSSYTHEMLPEIEMREWVENTVTRILSLHPQKVLEVGCGTGLLLSRIAPNSQEYYASDISKSAIDYTRNILIEQQQNLQHVQIFQCSANDFTNFPDKYFDAFILNSTCQYFPDSDYLLSVIKKAVSKIQNSGFLFIGDVRDHSLLEIFHAGVVLNDANKDTSLKQLKERIKQRVREDIELTIHPEFFYKLIDNIPEITQVNIIYKNGEYDNELNNFRYDVFLYVNNSKVLKNFIVHEWKTNEFNLTHLENCLKTLSNNQTLIIKNVPNSRVTYYSHILQIIKTNDESKKLDEINYLHSKNISFKNFIDIGKKFSKQVRLVPSKNNTLLDLIFVPAKYSTLPVSYYQRTVTTELFSSPVKARFNKNWQSNLRSYLKNLLPDYMVPSFFVRLEELPLSSHGKIDRKALPTLTEETIRNTNYIKPRNTIEKKLIEIWQNLFKIGQIGIQDNFFELGGHSLHAISLTLEIKNIFAKTVTISDIFSHPTIEKLANFLSKIETTEQISTIKKAPRHLTYFPLSNAQEQIWQHQSMAPKLPLYNEPVSITMHDEIDAAILEKSLNEIIKRHNIFRARFEKINEKMMQRFENYKPFKLPLVDLQNLPSEKQTIEAAKLAKEDAKKYFDLKTDAPIRFKLIKFNPNFYKLFIVVHHIITDAMTMSNIFIKELEEIYDNLVSGQSNNLVPPNIQYGDFAYWEHKQNHKPETFMYWQKRLANLPILQLPTVHQSSDYFSFKGDSLNFALPKKLSHSIEQLSRQLKTTNFTIMFTAFNILLYRYTHQTDLSIGSVIYNHNQKETEKTAGNFLNTVIFRNDLSGGPSFTNLLQCIQISLLEDHRNCHLPFPEIANILRQQKNRSKYPPIQAAFTMDPEQASIKQEWTYNQFDIHPEISKFHLTFALDKKDGAFFGRVEYNTSLFDEIYAKRMARHFKILLKSITRNPTLKISQLDILSEKEKKFFPTKKYIAHGTIQTLFEQQVKKTPNNTAIQFKNTSLSYTELNDRVNQLAHYLRKQGVCVETPVALYFERSIEMIIAILATVKAGGTYVPIDPGQPATRLKYILKDSHSKILLTQKLLQKKLCTFIEKFHTNLQIIILEGHIDKIRKQKKENPVCIIKPENLIYIMYTSGSTGKPKGVLLEHRNVIRLFKTTKQYFNFNHKDVWTLFHPYAFDCSVWELYGALLYGGKTIIVPKNILHSPQEFTNLLVEKQVTVLNQTPSASIPLMASDSFSKNKNLALRFIIYCGEALNFSILSRWFEYQNQKQSKLVNTYGPTETTIYVTYFPITKKDLNKNSIIGKPVPDTSAYVLDENLNQMPLFIPGELYIGGAGVARGYLNRPELTRERFIQNPFSSDPKDRLYKTGDLVRWLPDGNLEYLGRIDHQVKVRGFRIELGEIEAKLSAHKNVRECVVTAPKDHNDSTYLAAYVVMHEKPDQPYSTIQMLRHYLKKQLPDYMVPQKMMILDKLPLTPNGKIDRKALPEPDHQAVYNAENFVAPETAHEKTIAKLFCDILRIPKIGIHDSFFEMGGHSILAAEALSKINRELNTNIRMCAFFQNPSIAELVKLI